MGELAGVLCLSEPGSVLVSISSLGTDLEHLIKSMMFNSLTFK